MSADFTPTRGEFNDLKPFRFWCQKILPIAYDDSLSYYELLCKVVDYLNKAMEDVELLNDDMTGLFTAYNSLQEYVNTYFDNLDIQTEINDKLDAMASSGALTNLLSPVIPPIVTDWLNKNVTPTSPAIDKSLSISDAGADAKVSGDLLKTLYASGNTIPAIVFEKGSIEQGADDDFDGGSRARTKGVVKFPFDVTLNPTSVGTNPRVSISYFDNNGTFKRSSGWLNSVSVPANTPIRILITPNYLSSIDMDFNYILTSYTFNVSDKGFRNNGFLPSGTNLNDIKYDSVYLLSSASAYDNRPFSVGIIYTMSTPTYVVQYGIEQPNGTVWYRDYQNNAWRAWQSSSTSGSYLQNYGFLDSGTDLNEINLNSYYLLASSRTYEHAPFKEGLLITTLNGINSNVFVTQRAYQLYEGNMFWRLKTVNGWTDWVGSPNSNTSLKIGMFGDSVIWGSISGTQTDEGIPYYVENLTGNQVTNLGVGSQGWVAKVNGENALDHIRNTDTTVYDMITCMYGLNDWNVPLGSYTDTTEGTIMGNIYLSMKSILDRRPDTILVIMSFTNTEQGAAPLYRYGSTYGTSDAPYTGEDMYEEYKKFCDYYQLPFIDMKHSPLNGYALPSLLSDGVHPSWLGYKMLGCYVAGQIKSLIG